MKLRGCVAFKNVKARDARAISSSAAVSPPASTRKRQRLGVVPAAVAGRTTKRDRLGRAVPKPSEAPRRVCR